MIVAVIVISSIRWPIATKVLQKLEIFCGHRSMTNIDTIIAISNISSLYFFRGIS